MKKTQIIMSVLIIFALFVMPVLADSSNLSYNQFFTPSQGVQEIQNSPFGVPISKLNNYIDGILVFAIVAALAIALIKLVWGNPEQASDGYRRIAGIVIGVILFMVSLGMVFTSMGWQF
jgi:hypothetical protein